MIENPSPRSSLETQSATDVTIRLKNLEDLHSSTSSLLQQRLSDLSEIERRLSTLEESLKRRDEALGDAVAVVTVVDDEEEILSTKRQRIAENPRGSRRSQSWRNWSPVRLMGQCGELLLWSACQVWDFATT